MKLKLILTGLMMITGLMTMHSAKNKYADKPLDSIKWRWICEGRMGDAWYGTEDAKKIADVVVETQRDNGGWMKNIKFHLLTPEDKALLLEEKGGMSCLDNHATTEEMRYLARVYQHTGDERYKDSFIKALHMIFEAERDGGWGQYWPLRDNSQYWNYITFNDDLMTEVLKILKDISEGHSDFKGMVAEEDRKLCGETFDRGIDLIIRCQIDDNGVPAAWCAQHDPVTLLPAEGRPHELPSVSGQESAPLLKFLMTIKNPSEELQNTIHTAIAWLDSHKIPDKALESFVNSEGQEDIRIVDKPGSSLWGRFIQLGGKTGKEMYEAYFQKLKNRGTKRKYHVGDTTYVYDDYEIATTSYRPEMEYQPIYAIYDDKTPHLFYRFLYNFEDTDPVIDEKGVEVVTSLNPYRRIKYQFLGDWPQEVIEKDYPKWKERLEKKKTIENKK